MSNATASVSNRISTIAAATEAYLGYIDMLFGDDEEIVATESKKGEKNLAKAQKNYEANGKNAEDAASDLKSGSINEAKTKMVGVTKKTEMKKQTISESLKGILQALKEFFLSLFGQSIPTTTTVPVLQTEPKIEATLADIEAAFQKMATANTTEEWDKGFEEFRELVQNFGSRLADCRKELASVKETNKQMKKEKVAPRAQLRKLQQLNNMDFKDLGNIEWVHRELTKFYNHLARYYESKSVRNWMTLGITKKELDAKDLRDRTKGLFNGNEKALVANNKSVEKTLKKNQSKHDSYTAKYGTS